MERTARACVESANLPAWRPQTRTLAQVCCPASVEHKAADFFCQTLGGRWHQDDRRESAVCWLCDHPEATREDYHDVLRRKVRDRGWAVQYVESDRTPFAYTVGLHTAGLPELLVTGLSPDWAMRLLNTVARYVIDERVPAPGDTMVLPDNWHAEFVEVAQPDAHLTFAVELCGPDVRALQIVWRDEDDHSPWCPEFNKGGLRQPVLGVRGPKP